MADGFFGYTNSPGSRAHLKTERGKVENYEEDADGPGIYFYGGRKVSGWSGGKRGKGKGNLNGKLKGTDKSHGLKSVHEFEEGDLVVGVVKAVNDFGVFLDVGARKDALLPWSEVGNRPPCVGDELVDLVVSKVEADRMRLYVAIVGDAGKDECVYFFDGKSKGKGKVKGKSKQRKTLNGKPLEELVQGDKLVGTVCNVHDVGLFVDIGAVKEGLLPWSHVPEGIDFRPGDTMRDLYILGIDLSRQRISLGILEESLDGRKRLVKRNRMQDALDPAYDRSNVPRELTLGVDGDIDVKADYDNYSYNSNAAIGDETQYRSCIDTDVIFFGAAETSTKTLPTARARASRHAHEQGSRGAEHDWSVQPWDPDYDRTNLTYERPSDGRGEVPARTLALAHGDANGRLDSKNGVAAARDPDYDRSCVPRELKVHGQGATATDLAYEGFPCGLRVDSAVGECAARSGTAGNRPVKTDLLQVGGSVKGTAHARYGRKFDVQDPDYDRSDMPWALKVDDGGGVDGAVHHGSPHDLSPESDASRRDEGRYMAGRPDGILSEVLLGGLLDSRAAVQNHERRQDVVDPVYDRSRMPRELTVDGADASHSDIGYQGYPRGLRKDSATRFGAGAPANRDRKREGADLGYEGYPRGLRRHADATKLVESTSTQANQSDIDGDVLGDSTGKRATFERQGPFPEWSDQAYNRNETPGQQNVVGDDGAHSAGSHKDYPYGHDADCDEDGFEGQDGAQGARAEITRSPRSASGSGDGRRRLGDTPNVNAEAHTRALEALGFCSNDESRDPLHDVSRAQEDEATCRNSGVTLQPAAVVDLAANAEGARLRQPTLRSVLAGKHKEVSRARRSGRRVSFSMVDDVMEIESYADYCEGPDHAAYDAGEDLWNGGVPRLIEAELQGDVLDMERKGNRWKRRNNPESLLR